MVNKIFMRNLSYTMLSTQYIFNNKRANNFEQTLMDTTFNLIKTLTSNIKSQ